MSWNDEEAVAKPTTAATAATDLPESGQVTAENFLSPHSARLNGSDFRTTATSMDSKADTSRDAQIKQRLETARVLRKAVQKQFQARPKATVKDWAGSGVRETLRKKVSETESLLRQLHVRMEGTETSARKVNQSICILEREQHSLEEPAIICERRLLVRDQRPLDEQVEDDLQVALLNERFVLEQAYKMLSAYIDAGQELREALQAAKCELVADLQFKRHALRLEKSALQFDPYHGRDRACVLPLVPDGQSQKPRPSPEAEKPPGPARWRLGDTFLSIDKDDWGEENAQKSEESVQRSASHASELLCRTAELEQNATKFVDDSVTLMQSVKGKVQSAAEGTNYNMRRNMSQLLQSKKALEKGLAESQEDITQTEGLLQQMQQEMQGQKASLEEWEASPEISLDRLDQRLPLAVQQEIRQSAFERMQEQVQHAKSNVEVLNTKSEESQDLLSQLRESYSELREHLNAKTASWRIDLQCAKIKSSGKETSRSQVDSKDSSFVVPTPRRLSKQTLEMIRHKIKTAAYEGPHGQGFDVMFNRYDQDGSGCLSSHLVRRALRRTLRIPDSSISDGQIFSLCSWLDIDGCGTVEIDELVTFLGRGPEAPPKTETNSSSQVSNRSFELDCFVSPRKSQENNQKKPSNQSNRLPTLGKDMLNTLRSKIKAASYAGQLGCEVKAMFSRFDTTGSGVMEEEQLRQVIRRAMRIPPGVISDQQISKLCSMLDKDNAGVISIDALVDFVKDNPPQSGRKR